MTSFWRAYGVAAAWAVVLLPTSLAVFFVGYGLIDGEGMPNVEDVVWLALFSAFLLLPVMAVVDLAVSPVWILWRRAKSQSVFGLGSQAALVGLVAAFAAFLAYRATF